MRFDITAASPIDKQTLVVYDEGFSYSDGPGMGMGRSNRHWFREIVAVLRSTANPNQPVLSIQVGKTIYSIRYKPQDGQHRAAIDFLVKMAAQSATEAQQQ